MTLIFRIEVDDEVAQRCYRAVRPYAPDRRFSGNAVRQTLAPALRTECQLRIAQQIDEWLRAVPVAWPK